MKNFLLSLFLLLPLAASAQRATSFRIEKTENDTMFVVEKSQLILPDGTRIIEEIWRVFVTVDSLKNYLAGLEVREKAAATESEKAAIMRNDNAEKIRIEREKEGRPERSASPPPPVNRKAPATPKRRQ